MKGELSRLGPRHDNDFLEICKISIIPTKDEILASREPSLPSFMLGPSEFLPDGIARLLDMQFRLLREDMLNPIRLGISRFLTDLDKNKVQFKKLREEGGRFRYDKGDISGDLNVYTNIRFVSINVNRYRGFISRVAFTPPKIKSAKDEKHRLHYWERSRKLMSGSLICVLWQNKVNEDSDANSSQTYSLYFGVVVEKNEKRLSRFETEAMIDIHFIESSIYPIVLEDISMGRDHPSRPKRFMVESTGVYFESYNHILKTLRVTNPSEVPFRQYLVSSLEGGDRNIQVETPLYTRAPRFHFDLSILLKDPYDSLLLNVQDEISRENAIRKLATPNISVFDETQAKSLVDALSREIALIEGPPGTGKTYVGIELVKVLLSEKNRKATAIGPILTICYTNHALDQFLECLLDNNITKIVRLGSRSKSDRIKEFNLEQISRSRPKVSHRGFMLYEAYEELDEIKNEAINLQDKLSRELMTWNDVKNYLLAEYMAYYLQFTDNGTDFPDLLLNIENEESNMLPDETDKNGDEWTIVGEEKLKNQSIWDQWINGVDIRRREQLVQAIYRNQNAIEKNISKKGKGRDDQNERPNNMYEFLKNVPRDDESVEGGDESEEESSEDAFNYEESQKIIQNNGTNNIKNDETDETEYWLQKLVIPDGDRDLETLLEDTDVWNMSKVERKRVHDHLREAIRKEVIIDLADLEMKHTAKRKEIEDINDEGRREILENCQVIGLTTSGAAKYQSLIRSVAPRIIVVEEAGEVLEAHILSSLTPSTQHLILIGDHLQLRPHIATYTLSVDSQPGKYFMLDRSLFERLGVTMSQLTIQRRMRPEIADLIRGTLYPKLTDGTNTREYPKVRGTPHNLFFIDHRHSEDAAGSNQFALQSHSNTFEVEFVVELIRYFVRNGYDKPNDIAVLTPYLGQLIKLRDALRESFVVVIDERDNQDIEELLGEADPEYENPNGTVTIAEKRSLQRQVILKTVDNFQGEEATIVIVSLVRNTTSCNHGGIGFLKSSNRTNVLLSRAKHGMFMLGNADLLSERSDMWKSVIGLMRERGQVGRTFPILCESHPDIINDISSPKQFRELSPDGGCNSPCRYRMPCGHICSYKCHPDDPDHIGAAKSCIRPCLRLHDSCNHVCPLPCGDPCGECQIIVEDILLSCGHYFTSPKCYQSQDPKSIMCYATVTRILPTCGHELNVHCSSSIGSLRCDHECGIILEGCGHSCKNKCCECQKRSIAANNKEPKLDQQGHVMRTNHLKCIQRCGRILFCGHACASSCHKGACPPCKENCSAACRHSKCMLNCSEPWHRCASVCGEECPPQKYCVLCANDEIKSQVVDIYLQESFKEVDWEVHRLIVLECGHCFTMESMDSLMELDKYYVRHETTWIGLKIPPEEMSKVKSCPNCRHPISNVRRYGRVSKKIMLDAAKMKFLQKYTRSLKNARDSLEKTVKELENKRDQFIDKIVKSAKEKSIGKEYYKSQASNTKVPELTPVQQFAEVVQHDISKVHETLWANQVFRLIGCYREIFLIMTGTKDPPYKRAFDAAVVNLYHVRSAAETENIDVLKLVEQMESLNLSGKSSMHQLALQRECLQQVGIPLPVVSHGIYVKAFFEVVHIQKAMFMEAKHVVHALDLALNENINLIYLQSIRDKTTLQSINTRNAWIKFTRFILETTVEHLKIICEVAKETKYYRDYAFALLELSEIQCQYGGFILSYEIIDSNKSASEQATRIKKSVSSLCEDIQQRFTSLQNLIGLIDGEYIQKQFISRMKQISKDVNELENCRGKTILRSEKLEIFRAMNIELQGSGHWYQCPNGHTYAIANCGLANQASHCPECGANVGGVNYNLTAGNTRSNEYENLYQYNQ
ncbi:16549_t:CDS:10 [Funneliformis geosporum]|uniref:16549_t:CDS:1 n=1 Tax=Funneliformis geosporum TaxID=1117311 RepID=A0A9W4SHU9_9GLOM|nr:16549_t:CDS:10 [Funneliformis geosporum]